MATLIHTQSDTFENDVLGSEIPVIVDFYADWCGPCKAVAPVLEELSKEYDGRLKFVKVDVDANQDLSSSLGIVSIPTLKLYKTGNIVSSVTGAVSRDHLRQIINKVLD